MVRSAAKPSLAEGKEERTRSNVDANGCLRKCRAFFRQPTAEEVSRLIFGGLRDIGIYDTELPNQFAHLLNRGSSLE